MLLWLDFLESFAEKLDFLTSAAATCALCLRQPQFAGSFSCCTQVQQDKGLATSMPCLGGKDGASPHTAHPKVCLAAPFSLPEAGSKLGRAGAAVRTQQFCHQQLCFHGCKHIAWSWSALPYPTLLTHSITHSAGKRLWEHPRVGILHIPGWLYHPGTGLLLTVKSELPETVWAVTPCYVHHNHPPCKILSGIKQLLLMLGSIGAEGNKGRDNQVLHLTLDNHHQEKPLKLPGGCWDEAQQKKYTTLILKRKAH